jgi:hypothetical protein
MPNLPGPDQGSAAASTVLGLFRQLHDAIRHQLAGLDDDGVNWSPGADTNSIATLVTHVVGSEAETLRCVAGTPGERDRAEEFAGGPRHVAEVMDDLRRADDLISALEGDIRGQDLDTVLTLPTLPADDRRSGWTWLIGNYGHAREHAGHIQLTRQLLTATAAER